MLKLSYEEALHLLNRAVEEKGSSYIYGRAHSDASISCVYAVEDEQGGLAPSCIVGHVVNYINPQLLEELHALEGMSAYEALPDILDVDLPTRDLLTEAQHLQDEGYTWGKSVSEASMGV